MIAAAIASRSFAGFGVVTDSKGRITVCADPPTSRPKVYAGGDCVLGPSTFD